MAIKTRLVKTTDTLENGHHVDSIDYVINKVLIEMDIGQNITSNKLIDIKLIFNSFNQRMGALIIYDEL